MLPSVLQEAPPSVITACFASMLVLGMPHGAMDGAIAIYLGFGRTISTMISFSIVYAVASCLVAAVWMAIPSVAFALFMGMTLLHWGSGDALDHSTYLYRGLQIFTHGGIPLFITGRFHPKAFTMAAEITAGSSNHLLSLLRWGFPIFVVAVLVDGVIVFLKSKSCTEDERKERQLRYFELLGKIGLFASIDSNIAVAVYFCCIHSPRHMVRVERVMRSNPQAYQWLWITTGVFSFIPWIVLGLTYKYLLHYVTQLEATFHITFVGLASLTVPHMILGDGLFRTGRAAAKKD